MSNTIEKKARSFCEKNGGRVEERIDDDNRKYLVCVFESTVVYDSGVGVDDNHEHDLFAYYNGEIEKDDEIPQSKEVSSSTGALVVESVNKIMRSLKRTLYTNYAYCVDPECLFALDCSYYVKQVLKALPDNYYKVLPKSSRDGKTALAKDYYQFFVDLPTESKDADLWQRIEHIKYAKPGDIIAYKYADTSEHTTTGHVMVAYSTAVQSTCKDKNQHWVYVSDSANSGHRDDTRNKEGKYAACYSYIAYKGSSGKPSGVGIGKMWFNTGSKPYYRWSSCAGTKHDGIQISIGRPIKVE